MKNKTKTALLTVLQVVLMAIWYTADSFGRYDSAVIYNIGFNGMSIERPLHVVLGSFQPLFIFTSAALFVLIYMDTNGLGNIAAPIVTLSLSGMSMPINAMQFVQAARQTGTVAYSGFAALNEGLAMLMKAVLLVASAAILYRRMNPPHRIKSPRA